MSHDRGCICGRERYEYDDCDWIHCTKRKPKVSTSIISSANNRQVAGSHYSGKFQHWDWVIDTGVNYLIGNATKYVSRYPKKNGLQDLEKALHYVQKLEEVFCGGRDNNFVTEHEDRRRRALTELFIKENPDLNDMQREFFRVIVCCNSMEHFTQMRKLISDEMNGLRRDARDASRS